MDDWLIDWLILSLVKVPTFMHVRVGSADFEGAAGKQPGSFEGAGPNILFSSSNFQVKPTYNMQYNII